MHARPPGCTLDQDRSGLQGGMRRNLALLGAPPLGERFQPVAVCAECLEVGGVVIRVVSVLVIDVQLRPARRDKPAHFTSVLEGAAVLAVRLQIVSLRRLVAIGADASEVPPFWCPRFDPYGPAFRTDRGALLFVDLAEAMDVGHREEVTTS